MLCGPDWALTPNHQGALALISWSSKAQSFVPFIIKGPGLHSHDHQKPKALIICLLSEQRTVSCNHPPTHFLYLVSQLPAYIILQVIQNIWRKWPAWKRSVPSKSFSVLSTSLAVRFINDRALVSFTGIRSPLNNGGLGRVSEGDGWNTAGPGVAPCSRTVTSNRCSSLHLTAANNSSCATASCKHVKLQLFSWTVAALVTLLSLRFIFPYKCWASKVELKCGPEINWRTAESLYELFILCLWGQRREAAVTAVSITNVNLV